MVRWVGVEGSIHALTKLGMPRRWEVGTMICSKPDWRDIVNASSGSLRTLTIPTIRCLFMTQKTDWVRKSPILKSTMSKNCDECADSFASTSRRFCIVALQISLVATKSLQPVLEKLCIILFCAKQWCWWCLLPRYAAAVSSDACVKPLYEAYAGRDIQRDSISDICIIIFFRRTIWLIIPLRILSSLSISSRSQESGYFLLLNHCQVQIIPSWLIPRSSALYCALILSTSSIFVAI